MKGCSGSKVVFEIDMRLPHDTWVVAQGGSEPHRCMLGAFARLEGHRNGRTYKDIRGQAIDLSARRRSRGELAHVEEGVSRHPVAGEIEAPGRAAGRVRGGGAVAERVVGAEVDGEGVVVAGGGIRRGSPGFCRREEMGQREQANGDSASDE